MIFLKLVVLDETKKANYSEQNGYGGGGGGGGSGRLKIL